MTQILVDGDACPVKAEVEKVAARHGLAVTIVSNGGLRPSGNPRLRHVLGAGGVGRAPPIVSMGGLRPPPNPRLRHVIVAEGADAADDWIVEHIAAGDI